MEKDENNNQAIMRQGSGVRFQVSNENGRHSSQKSPFIDRRSGLSPAEVKTDSRKITDFKPRKRVSTNFNSLDYNAIENQQFLEQKYTITPRNLQHAALMRWFVNFLVGVGVAVVAIVVAVLITYISKAKFMALYALLEDCSDVSCLVVPGVVWILINVFLVLIGSYLVTCHAPHAAGSGIPQIKCYLNGIKLPGLLSMKTLVAKAGGVVLSVCGGLACGKEGPMIHSGSIMASCIARGEFKCGKSKCSPSCCEALRTDEERRDFVAAGAASGVSAAFASPVGGVLFSLEEGASFLRQMLTWRMLFSSMTASVFLNIMMSAIKGYPGEMGHPGLVSFGYIGDISFKTYELPLFMLQAVIGGLLGALFNQLNYHLTLLRRRKVTKSWQKICESGLVAGCSAIILLLLIYVVPDCQPIHGYETNHTTDIVNQGLNTSLHDLHKRDLGLSPADHEANLTHFTAEGHGDSHEEHPLYGDHGGHGYTFQGFCPYGEHNRMADILFKTPEGGLHAMLHAPLEEWSYVPLIVLLIVYHLLATWTYGLMVSSGVFIPSLLIGAISGRLFGMTVIHLFPSLNTGIAKYALIGAACQLGGTVRMTISLTVIIIECTGDITFGIPIMLSLIIAKWIGDFFNPGIYDLHIEIMGIPLLPWEPSEMVYHVTAKHVMSSPVEVLRTTEKISVLLNQTQNPDSHHGFPVVEDYDPSGLDPNNLDSYGRLKGFIHREQLPEIIEQHGAAVVRDGEKADVDLERHMDRAPYSIQEAVSLPRIFKLFRGLGLRHLVVVNDKNRVTGIITRLNLARFREEAVKGQFKLEELDVTDK